MVSDNFIAAEPIPVSLLTGFLGSGKTTVLNGLLRHPVFVDLAAIVSALPGSEALQSDGRDQRLPDDHSYDRSVQHEEMRA